MCINTNLAFKLFLFDLIFFRTTTPIIILQIAQRTSKMTEAEPITLNITTLFFVLVSFDVLPGYKVVSF